MHLITLDYVDNLELNGSIFPPVIRLLSSLQEGLDYLYSHVQATESQTMSTGDLFANAPLSHSLVECAFRWYSVSICDYVKIVGLLAYEEDENKANEYMSRVIPDIHTWRNKVGAHAAFANPRKKDWSTYELMPELSSQFLVWHENESAFVAEGWIKEFTQSSDLQCRDISWSLTKAHRELSKRYWPNVQ